MNYEIVELVDFSGIRATIYTVINKGHNITLFDQLLGNLNFTDDEE